MKQPDDTNNIIYQNLFLHTTNDDDKREFFYKSSKTNEETKNLQIYFLTNCKKENKTYYEK